MRLPHPRLSLPLFGALLLAFPLAAQQPATRPAPKSPPATKGAASRIQPPRDTTPAPRTTGLLQGVVVDSIHAGPLTHAMISVDGTARMAFSDSLGRFLVDSVPPGSHRVFVEHPMLDTLGISLVTPPMDFTANMVTQTVIGVPSGE